MEESTIIIIGGLGPFAGLDVNKKIYENTVANNDSDHLDVVCISMSNGIPNRNQYLLGNIDTNPATVVVEKVKKYPLDGVVGIACNTFHSPKIFNVFKSELGRINPGLKIVHLPDEVRKKAEINFNNGSLGVLSTIGTFEAKVYQDTFKGSNVSLIFPNKKGRDNVHDAILNTNWGIKQNGTLTPKSSQLIQEEIRSFVDQNVDGILLACTELPLVSDDIDFMGLKYIDTNTLLARELIKRAAPEKIKS